MKLSNVPVNRTILLVTSSVALAAAMVASAWLLSKFLVKVQRETTITAKGYAERTVMSDMGSFSVTVNDQDSDLKRGYGRITGNIDRVLKLLGEFGFTEAEITVGGIRYNKVFRFVNGSPTNDFLYYDLSQNIRVCSRNVTVISGNYRKLNELMKDGIQIDVSSPEYFISNPEQYKLELTAAASKSAAARAREMAQAGGAELKELLSSRLGVIQINCPASSEMNDYGVYDTSTPEKVIKVVVAQEFSTR
ncbi:MAG: SIMPL domain-containing protein [Victivallaceae bacterium]|nr:SIMPL domain-containing protein [Victivallaceae bacterium]